jgi:DNA polymerase III subunit epsilon
MNFTAIDFETANASRASACAVGLDYPASDYFCTMVISRVLWPQHPSYSLDYLARTFGILFRHHDAEEDACACARVAIAACEQLETGSLYDLEGTQDFRVGRLYPRGYCPCGAARGMGRRR